jgi:hypothetical protein
MSEKKSKRSRRDDDDAGIAARGSGVNYSKVADRHVDDDRFEKHRQGGSAPAATTGLASAAASGTSPAQPKVSAQMAAVMRVMAGKEERTIAEKLADSNRPTWEQYKKDNQDKLDIAGVDKKKMEAYRKELDQQREKLLTRGTNHQNEKDDRKAKKKKKKKRRRQDDRYSSESETSSYSSESRSHKRKKHKKKHKKPSSSSKHKKKKHRKKKRDGDDGSSSSGDSYRLSNFFTSQGSDDGSSK